MFLNLFATVLAGVKKAWNLRVSRKITTWLLHSYPVSVLDCVCLDEKEMTLYPEYAVTTVTIRTLTDWESYREASKMVKNIGESKGKIRYQPSVLQPSVFPGYLSPFPFVFRSFAEELDDRKWKKWENRDCSVFGVFLFLFFPVRSRTYLSRLLGNVT